MIIVGVAVTFCGQIINNLGTNIVKYSHIISESNQTDNENKKKKSWLFFVAGWLMFVVGISFDFVSFAFTAQSILAAVVSVQFISNLIFAKLILKENITKRAGIGSIMILVGTILIGVFGDHQSSLISGADLLQFLKSKVFIMDINNLWIEFLIQIYLHCYLREKEYLIWLN